MILKKCGLKTIPKEKGNDMIRFFILILIIGFSSSLKSNEIAKQDLYKKIDLFGEVWTKYRVVR